MKTLKNHTILYDGACPMCRVYTKTFVSTGMLDENARLPYQHLPQELARRIDCKRARDEIALIDTSTGEVHYGIRSLLLVIGHSFGILKPLFRSGFFIAIADKCYKFISFNRRIIMPSGETGSATDPSFHLGYRICFLLCTWVLTAATLNGYAHLLNGLIPPGPFWREYLVCGGQMIWQAIFIRFTNPGHTWNYLGTMMTISFAGGILLQLIKFSGSLFSASPVFFAAAFLMVAALMLAEHIRRVKLLELNALLSVSWIVYRLFVLLIILM